MSISFEIPMLPPSVNHYTYHGLETKRSGETYVGHRKTPEAKKFMLDFGFFVNQLQPRFVTGERFEVWFDYYLGPRDRGDWDNYNKCLADAIAGAGMLRNLRGQELSDAWIKRAHVDIHDSAEDRKVGPKTLIRIAELRR